MDEECHLVRAERTQAGLPNAVYPSTPQYPWEMEERTRTTTRDTHRSELEGLHSRGTCETGQPYARITPAESQKSSELLKTFIFKTETSKRVWRKLVTFSLQCRTLKKKKTSKWAKKKCNIENSEFCIRFSLAEWIHLDLDPRALVRSGADDGRWALAHSPH